jgi:hypothetical protein
MAGVGGQESLDSPASQAKGAESKGILRVATRFKGIEPILFCLFKFFISIRQKTVIFDLLNASGGGISINL